MISINFFFITIFSSENNRKLKYKQFLEWRYLIFRVILECSSFLTLILHSYFITNTYIYILYECSQIRILIENTFHFVIDYIPSRNVVEMYPELKVLINWNIKLNIWSPTRIQVLKHYIHNHISGSSYISSNTWR